jgi:hypothetical protein
VPEIDEQGAAGQEMLKAGCSGMGRWLRKWKYIGFVSPVIHVFRDLASFLDRLAVLRKYRSFLPDIARNNRIAPSFGGGVSASAVKI